MPLLFVAVCTWHPHRRLSLTVWFTVNMQGIIFGIIGLGAGVIGTTMSNGLLKLRKKLDPKFEPQNKPPDVALNAATWALHMGLSSNLRYQALNGLDMVCTIAMC